MKIKELEKELNSNYKVRYKKNHKKRFRSYVEECAKELGYEAHLQETKLNKNAVFGNLEEAKYIVGAHYDTPFFSRHITFITRFFGYWIGQFILVPLFLVLAILIGGLIADLINIPDLTLLLSMVAFVLVAFPFMFYNPNNANDNTSGVLGVFSVMKKLPLELRDKVAFVLFDNEEWGCLGSGALSNHLTKKEINNKFIFNMDCIGLGEHLYVCGKKHKTRDLFIDILKKEADADVKVSNFKYAYPTDHISFKEALSVCVYSKALVTKTVSLKNYHSPRDTVIDLDKISIISDSIVKTICEESSLLVENH